jgi:hypothetical protein
LNQPVKVDARITHRAVVFSQRKRKPKGSRKVATRRDDRVVAIDVCADKYRGAEEEPKNKNLNSHWEALFLRYLLCPLILGFSLVDFFLWNGENLLHRLLKTVKGITRIFNEYFFGRLILPSSPEPNIP